jgi:glyoxylase-like metal-dependent hydrolase (beta-lactamase superfamily II)
VTGRARASQLGHPVPGRELAPGAHVIGAGTRPYATGGLSRAYLFEEGTELTLVDTLWDDDAHLILRYLNHLGRSPSELTRILLTHAHRSHLGGVALLRELSRAGVYAHESEVPVVDGRRHARAVAWRPVRPLVLYPFRIAAGLGVPKHVPCPVDDVLQGGETLGPLEVLHTPGHTPGHMAFRWKGDGTDVLVAGDAVATWPQVGAGWPGFNLDEGRYRQSLRRLVALGPEVIGPGHGDPIIEVTPRCLAALVRSAGD